MTRSEMLDELEAQKHVFLDCMGRDQARVVEASKRIMVLRGLLRDNAAMVDHLHGIVFGRRIRPSAHGKAPDAL